MIRLYDVHYQTVTLVGPIGGVIEKVLENRVMSGLPWNTAARFAEQHPEAFLRIEPHVIDDKRSGGARRKRSGGRKASVEDWVREAIEDTTSRERFGGDFSDALTEAFRAEAGE